jgi:MarR-like DNA-binding transcriptional regulator SgrR of sgrS sRNA
MNAIDSMLSKEDNIQKIVGELETELQANPLSFFSNRFLPLVPQSMKEEERSAEDDHEKARQIRDMVQQMAEATGMMPQVHIHTDINSAPSPSSPSSSPTTDQ